VAKPNKKRMIALVIIFILMLLLFFIFEDFGFYRTITKEQLFVEPYNITRETVSSVSNSTYLCENRNFRYSTLGGNVDSVGKSVRPNLIINNLEDKWGFFKVNISYMDEEKYPYVKYGGENLIKMVESGEISTDDADFNSIMYEFFIPPAESILLDDLTEKKYPEKNYWAIANVLEPNFEYCYDKITYFNQTKNITFTEYRNVNKKITVKEYTTLADYGIDFIDWLMIDILMILIIILVRKIRETSK
jgi:hypothetical protein